MKSIILGTIIFISLTVYTTEKELEYSKDVQTDIITLEDNRSSMEMKERAIKKLGKIPDRNICTIFAKLVEKDNNRFIRRKLFLQLTRIVKAKPEFRDILLSIVASASIDNDGIMREMACDILGAESNEKNTTTLLHILQEEFKRKPEERGRKNDLRLKNFWGTETVITKCIDILISSNKLNIKIIKDFYKHSKHKDLNYGLAHILYKLGEVPDVSILINAVKKSSSTRVRVYAIYDLKEIGDKRAISVIEDATKNKFKVIGKTGTYFPIKLAAEKALKSLKIDD